MRPLILQLLQSIASLRGWTSDTATNGEVALELVSQVTPELVLSDTNKQRMNCLDLTRTLKRIPQPAHVPVVLMSGLGGETEEHLKEDWKP
jgi:two-component system cell cycle response regulator